MNVRELLGTVCSKDVMTDYSDMLYTAFEGSESLTEEGKKHFKCILDNDVIFRGKYNVIIHCENDRQEILLTELFHTLAGFWSNETYEKYVVIK